MVKADYNAQALFSLLGGEDNAAARFPAHCAALSAQGEAALAGYMNILSVGRGRDDPSNVYVTTQFILNEPRSGAFCAMHSRAVTKSAGREISRSQICAATQSYSVAALKIPAEHVGDCVVELYGCDLGGKQVLTGKRELSASVLADVTASFAVEHPAQKPEHRATSDKIIMSFAGTAIHGTPDKDKLDYYQPYFSGPFILPSKGTLTLGGGVEFTRCVGAALQVINSSGQIKTHSAPVTNISFDKNVLRWGVGDMLADWGFLIYSFAPYCSNLYYTLSLTCRLSISPDEDYTFLVTNRTDIPAAGFTHKIPVIVSYCDCVGAGTLISLFDGERAPIEDIMPGQLLADGAGGSSKVLALWKTQGVDNMYSLTTDDGRALQISKYHKVLGSKGLTSAHALTVDGVTAAPADPSPVTAYNLELESGETFVANGFTVQGVTAAGMRYDRDKTRETLSPEYIADFDNLDWM